jgi:choline dehydrogenase-like flavoprotein
MAEQAPHYAAVVIGSGFGGSMTALSLARAFKGRNRQEKVLMLERGTWWTTPVPTVQDREVETYEFLRGHGQPVQYWASANSFRGFVDIVTRCVRRPGNEDGLYDVTTFGKKGLFGLLTNDGVSIMRASGVGGGSLVYSNVTIQPPDLVFDDPRWPTHTKWDKATRDGYYQLARNAIGLGVLFALQTRDHERDAQIAAPPPPNPVNTGLSNIATRSSGLPVAWRTPSTLPGLHQIDPAAYPDPRRPNDVWIDRARVFQLAMSQLTADYGTVDSSINDKPLVGGQAKNYCERQGRCNIGCLVGARHTLNKQLQAAIYGSFTGSPPPPLADSLELWPLCEVKFVRALPTGGYEIELLARDHDKASRSHSRTVTADRVILAAGCVGTTELLLRSKDKGTLPGLSDRVGSGFSTNGDYLAFLNKTKYHISLTRGPFTTSFAHFNTPQSGAGADPARFHTIEDQGIPPAMASLVRSGIPLLQSLSRGHHRRGRLYTLLAIALFLWRRLVAVIRGLFTNYRTRAPEFASEDEYTMNMMCIAAMGREASVGRFRLGKGPLDTELRVRREDGRSFEADPIYDEIRKTLDSFATHLTDDRSQSFRNPFLTEAAELAGARSITLSHPLGGAIMGKTADDGAVDERGRVFDTGSGGVYPGLYVVDGAAIPTALGVNPSLTIAALALRAADHIIEEINAAEPPAVAAAGP